MNAPMEAGLDAREPYSSTHRFLDPRMTPRRRGAGRVLGITLSLLAAIGAGAAGGYHIWKTQLVRPALVRHLPRMPALVADLAPVPAASAATDGETGSVAEAPVRQHGDPAAPATGSAEASPAPGAAGPSVPEMQVGAGEGVAANGAASEGRTGPRTTSITGVPASRIPEGLQAPGAVGAATSGSSEQPRATSPAASPAPVQAPALEPRARAGLDSPAGTAAGPAAGTEGFGEASRPDPGPVIEIRKGIRDDRVAASLERAYGAFRAGDLESAAEAYRAVVRHEPGNRDALLGLAAVATRTGGWDEAAGHYARVLAFHPADSVAQAALIAVGGQDSARGESRLKALLWREPEAAHLHFDLGNVYAAQSRWPEARQSFFSAYRFDRENADYAYNLAVSLDHLSRRERALHFYHEALALARSRPSSFDATAVRARIREVGTSAGEAAAPLRPSSEPAGAGPVAGGR